MTTKRTLRPAELLQNVMAGLTVSFVALSLGAAFGVLSGRGAFAGMLSAALIALVTSLLGGTRIQCAGPTGPMTAVTAIIVASAHDRVAELPGVAPHQFVNAVLLLSAVLLVAMGLLRLGKFIVYVPNVVISGFMNGIAIIIWVDQIKKLLGLGETEPFGGPASLNAALCLAAVALSFLIPRVTRRRMPKYASLLSGTLFTIVILTLVAVAVELPVARVELAGSLRSWSDVTALVSGQLPSEWSPRLLLGALPFALQLAVLCYLDTLLTSLVIDKMTGERTKQDKELAAQGVSIAAAAMVGGIPGAQATIRSVLIVKEKATLRLAGVLVGVFALIEMVLLQDVINLIPQSVFAGILVKVGYDVFDWLPLRLYAKELARDWHDTLHGFFARHNDEKIFVTNHELALIAGTTLVTVLWDLNVAVAAFTALFYIVNRWVLRSPMRDLKPADETEGIGDEL